MTHGLMRYDPDVGYTFTPDLKLRMEDPSGGYLVRTNAAGFRSEREFTAERQPGKVRALLFGDSQTAGDGVNNRFRFSDCLEGLLPGLDVYNYGLTGTGTDQQYQIYRHHAKVEHDLVIVAVFVENIRRIVLPATKFKNDRGEYQYRAKPYFTLEDDRLVLHHVPVPKQPWTPETVPPQMLEPASRLRRRSAFTGAVKAALRHLPAGPLRRLATATAAAAARGTGYQPVPDYDSADTHGWQILRAILSDWIKTSAVPVLIVPLPMWTFIERSSDPSGIQARFGELARETGAHVYDPLADLWALPTEEQQSFWNVNTGHYSKRGHEVLARLLAPVVAEIVPRL